MSTHPKKISESNIENILLASVANHSQYPGKKLSHLSDNPYQYLLEKMKLGDARPAAKTMLQDYLDSLD